MKSKLKHWYKFLQESQNMKQSDKGDEILKLGISAASKRKYS